MLKSMTGYGKSNFENDDMRITVEIRTLNSKQLDVNMRISSLLKQKELEIRNLLSKNLIRGKVDCMISLQSRSIAEAPEIDKKMADYYYREIKSVHDSMDETATPDYLALILKMPEVLISKEGELTADIWNNVKETIEKAIEKVNIFRLYEGSVLKEDFIRRITAIVDLLKQVEPFEKARTVRIKQRIQQHVNEFLDGANANPERLEQEMIYYMEKLDITEEKIRLKKHCDYFLTVLDKEENAGKKLAFVTQEIGREINTLGSKANDADLQRIVVLMKDELEKIKEQLFNIL